MARETRPPPSSGLPGRLPGLGRRRVIAMKGDPTRGAAEAAPTAPHATQPVDHDRSYPARFWGGLAARIWDVRRARVAISLMLIVSLGVHVYLSGFWKLPPKIDFKDVTDDLTIPVDLIGEEAPPAPPTPPADTPPASTANDPNGVGAKDAGVKKDAGPKDAAPDADPLATDGGLAAIDGGTVMTDAGVVDGGDTDGGTDGGGLVAAADGGAPGANGPRDPGSMIGMAGLITAGSVNVTLLVNVAVIRQHPIGKRTGPLLAGIPQWNSFLKGTQTTFDPIRDTDWILIYGPSLIHTDRDAFIIRYSSSDAVVDNAADLVSKTYDKGGKIDTGVPGVKGWLFHADQAERVALRAQSHVLVIVPPDKKTEFAKVMSKAPISPRVRPGEAMRLTVKDPWRQVAIPGLKFSQSLKELRLWILPRNSDGGADVYAEGDCTEEAAAVEMAAALTDLIKQRNVPLVRAFTHGILNGVKVEPDGTHIRAHLSASNDQLETLLNFMGNSMGVNVPPP